MAEDASNLIVGLGFERAQVYGSSMDGMMPPELALRHPDQVSRLVLGSTMPGGPEAARVSDEILQILVASSKLMFQDPDTGIEMLMSLPFLPEFTNTHPEIKPLMLLSRSPAPTTPPETVDKLIGGLPDFNAYDQLNQNVP
jgi:pimeloyl-ACP methyl ester carboxylesterase